MYGINAPAGFIPVQAQNNGVLAASEITLPIAATAANSYNNNIFTGDLVIWSTALGANAVTSLGYVANYFDYINAVLTTPVKAKGVGAGGYPLLGIFAGCSYFSQTDLVNPAAPRRSWFPANTISTDGKDATAYIIPLNFDYLCSVQAGATPFTPSMVGRYAKVVYQTVVSNANLVDGDTRTGTSFCSVDLSSVTGYVKTTAATTTADTARDTILIMGIDDKPNAQSILTPQASSAVPYGNVLVRLTNSAIPLATNFPV
jgi:hypothetical protein